MPELPEVETVVRDLRPMIQNKRIVIVRVGRKPLRRRWSKLWNKLIEQRRIKEIDRRGKWIVVKLHDGQALLVHLGMTGQFTVVPAETSLESHTHIVFVLEPGTHELRFRDIRRFGSVSLFSSHEELSRFFAESGLGPEPWDVSRQAFRNSLAQTERCIKAVLLDQQVVAGVGNIYADESLFESRIHPSLRGCDLTPEQSDRLRRAVGRVLNRAIERRGSSIRNYVGGSGLKGGYQDEFRVYGRTGEPCIRCRAPIERTRLAGRSTHFCPACQRT